MKNEIQAEETNDSAAEAELKASASPSTPGLKPLAERTKPAEAGGTLLGQVLRFGRLLRLMGVGATLGQMLDLARALEYAAITSEADFYCAARALLVSRHDDEPVFDQAFALFWRPAATAPNARPGEKPRRRARLPGEAGDGGAGSGEPRGGVGRQDEPADQGQRLVAERVARYSPMEILRHKDFAEMSWEELQAAHHAIAGLRWNLAQRKTRRYRRGRRGRLDLRAAMRRSLASGGEVLELSYRSRIFRPRPLVVLCDVSGSMDRYSRMLLHFIHAFMHGLTSVGVEAFVFGTRLTRVTHHLQHKDVDQALDEVGKAAPDWAGGTRIGEALKTFNFHWARRVLGRSAVVLIISDGWDRGNVDLLSQELDRLQRSAYRLMWLNPLAGGLGYEPSQRGMAAVLAHVDDLLPGCDLSSLEQLAQILSAIPMERPGRRQRARLPAEGSLPVAGEPALAEHPYVAVVKEYPWLNIFTQLGRMNNEGREPM